MKHYLNILIIAVALTIFGFLMDGDAKEPSTIMRFVEFFAMVGILFSIGVVLKSLFIFTKNKINLL